MPLIETDEVQQDVAHRAARLAAMRYLQEGRVTERIVIAPWSTGAR